MDCDFLRYFEWTEIHLKGIPENAAVTHCVGNLHSSLTNMDSPRHLKSEIGKSSMKRLYMTSLFQREDDQQLLPTGIIKN